MANNATAKSGPQNTVQSGDAPSVAKVKPTAADLKPLFADYEAKDKEVRVLEESLKQANIARSAAVEKIGEKTGPGFAFDYKGKRLTIMNRKNKELDTTTYFFRGESEKEALTIV